MAGQLLVREYRPSDRRQIREICVVTAWMGKPALDRIADEWIWAEYWTRYFTDREPEHAWVATRLNEGPVVGYLTGTADARRFERYFPRLFPGIVHRVVSRRLLRYPASRRAIFGLLGSVMRGELDIPSQLRTAYPATLHIDLLPEARGQGVARRMVQSHVECMRARRVRGIHAQTLSPNLAVSKFNESVGFRLVSSRPFTTYRHLDGVPLLVHTWVLDL